MSVEVRLPTMLQRVAGGAKVVRAEGETIRDLLDVLNGRFPGLEARLLAGDGQLHRFINVFLNDEDIRFLSHLDTRLSDGDVVSILPAMAGGRPA